jgi:hypothetical protein
MYLFCYTSQWRIGSIILLYRSVAYPEYHFVTPVSGISGVSFCYNGRWRIGSIIFLHRSVAYRENHFVIPVGGVSGNHFFIPVSGVSGVSFQPNYFSFSALNSLCGLFDLHCHVFKGVPLFQPIWYVTKCEILTFAISLTTGTR